MPGRTGEVEPEALLAPVRVLVQHVHRPAQAGQSGVHQSTHRVAALDVFDLDHFRAPVGEDRGRGRHEGVLGDFEDADAFHHIGHGGSLASLGEHVGKLAERLRVPGGGGLAERLGQHRRLDARIGEAAVDVPVQFRSVHLEAVLVVAERLGGSLRRRGGRLAQKDDVVRVALGDRSVRFEPRGLPRTALAVRTKVGTA